VNCAMIAEGRPRPPPATVDPAALIDNP